MKEYTFRSISAKQSLKHIVKKMNGCIVYLFVDRHRFNFFFIYVFVGRVYFIDRVSLILFILEDSMRGKVVSHVL